MLLLSPAAFRQVGAVLSGVLGRSRKKLRGWTLAGERHGSAAGCMHCAVHAKDCRSGLMTGASCRALVPRSRKAVYSQGTRAWLPLYENAAPLGLLKPRKLAGIKL